MPKRNIRKAIYPGTFDPVTNGHLSLIERATHLFDEIIVAVVRNAGKNPMFAFDERLVFMRQAIEKESFRHRVKVVGFDGLLADLAVQT